MQMPGDLRTARIAWPMSSTAGIERVLIIPRIVGIPALGGNPRWIIPTILGIIGSPVGSQPHGGCAPLPTFNVETMGWWHNRRPTIRCVAHALRTDFRALPGWLSLRKPARPSASILGPTGTVRGRTRNTPRLAQSMAHHVFTPERGCLPAPGLPVLEGSR